jgi:hypothetical protein
MSTIFESQAISADELNQVSGGDIDGCGTNVPLWPPRPPLDSAIIGGSPIDAVATNLRNLPA